MSYFLILTILVFLAAVTAASETAVITSSRAKLRKLASEGSKSAKALLKILETPEHFFGTILVANNIVDALIASLVTAVAIKYLNDERTGVMVATAIVTVLIIISEVAAKTLAAHNPIRISLRLSRFVNMLVIVLAPVVRVLARITNFIVRLVGGEAKGKPSLIAEEEIRALIKVGEEDDVLQRDKYRMLSKVFDFSDALVKNVMTPKSEVVSVDLDGGFDDIVNGVLESGYSRFPVYKGSRDNIVGVINMKDLLSMAANRGLVVMQDIIYPPTYVDPSKKVTDLLKDFQKGHTHIAIVSSGKGVVEGIITLEDLLEEIVGEINDEHDVRDRNHGKRQ